MTSHRGPWGTGRLDVQAHAGAQGYYVGNTWSAFAFAIELGARNVELDVRVTADGVPVVWHDMVLAPHEVLASDERLYGRRIDELTYAELQRVEVGVVTRPEHPAQRPVPAVRVLRLVDLFRDLSALCPTVWFTVEIKLDADDPAQVTRRADNLYAVLEAVDAGGVRDRAIVHSFDWATLALARDVAPDLPRSALVRHGETWAPGSPFVGERTYEAAGGDAALAAYRLGADALAPCFLDVRGAPVVTAALVDRAHSLGIAVNPWTVDPPSAHAWLLRAGVDGIVTNHPERLTGVSTTR